MLGDAQNNGKLQSLADIVKITRPSPIPLYHQVAVQIEEFIKSGRLEPGQKIDNEVALAKDLDVSRPTMRQAIDVLVRKGLLVRRRGIGTQVTRPSLNRPVGLTSLFDDLQKSGAVPTTEVLEFKKIAASPELAEVFDIEPGDMLLYIERLRFANEAPLALMSNWLPEKLDAITLERLVSGSLYKQLEAMGHAPKTAIQKFSARVASPEIAALFKIEVGAPLLAMRRTSYDASGTIVEHAENLYLGDGYALETYVTA